MNVDATPHNRAADAALRVFGRTLDRVRADRLVGEALQIVGDDLFVQGDRFDLGSTRRIFVCGAGKAAPAMARAVVEALGSKVDGGLVVTKHGHGTNEGAFRTIEAGHPIPDEASLRAGEEMLRFARDLDERDLVVFVLSGGASSLMEAPIEGVTLDDLRAMNGFLMRSGVPIAVTNAVRRRVSKIKGGCLAKAFAPSTVLCLVLSDVLGNSLATIGSGPFVEPAPGSDVSLRYAHAEGLPIAVRRALLAPKGIDLREPASVRHAIVGSVSLAVHAAMAAAEELGIEGIGYLDPMQGEARDMSRTIVRIAERRREAHRGEPFCLVFGGETTVTLRVEGKGGRCQEMAVAAAPKLARMADCAFLAAGTDGSDGPTDAAGATCDPDTVSRAGIDVRDALARHTSYDFLKASDNLIFTGPTGSNVNDVALFVSLP